MYVKPFTRHNDKLGFDYSVPGRVHVASYSEQFKESTYGKEAGFLQDAINFYRRHSQEPSHDAS